MINPTVCIGHGAGAVACPVEAIKLVFGTERRGVDIPYVKPTFETNVPAIFIADELGGMGMIRKAAEQGRQATESISRSRAQAGQLDVVIVGAGPAGLSATLAAMERNLRFVTVEHEHSLGGCVYHYPRNKIVATQPVALPIVGKMELGEVTKENLLEFWQGIVNRVGMPLNFSHCVEKITPVDRGFVVKTGRAEYQARPMLLAIGRRGTPRKLGVPGEEQPTVVHRLVDPEQYQDKRVLVVGGGNSAIEAEVAVAAEPGSHVTLSYRGTAFSRVSEKNRARLDEAQRSGQLDLALGSTVKRFVERSVPLDQGGQSVSVKNDTVIVCAGGVLPTPMLKEIGVLPSRPNSERRRRERQLQLFKKALIFSEAVPAASTVEPRIPPRCGWSARRSAHQLDVGQGRNDILQFPRRTERHSPRIVVGHRKHSPG